MKNTRKKNQSSCKLNSQKGFSFLEIIIVIGIIGGLLAFILPQIQNNQARAKVGQSKLAMGNVIQNLTMYQNDCTKFPTSLEGLVKSDGCANWNGPYLKSVPPDGFGTKFIYESDGSTFTVKSLGGDRKEGGDGYNRDITQEDL